MVNAHYEDFRDKRQYRKDFYTNKELIMYAKI